MNHYNLFLNDIPVAYRHYAILDWHDLIRCYQERTGAFQANITRQEYYWVRRIWLSRRFNSFSLDDRPHDREYLPANLPHDPARGGRPPFAPDYDESSSNESSDSDSDDDSDVDIQENDGDDGNDQGNGDDDGNRDDDNNGAGRVVQFLDYNTGTINLNITNVQLNITLN